MNERRVSRVLQNMEAKGLSQILISSPSDIFFLTGRLIDPGERLLALYLNRSGVRKIYINNLFTVPEDLGAEKIRFSDSDDSIGLLFDGIDHTQPLGIDRNFAARFLLPLIDRKAATGYVLASDCVGAVRSCKDETEIALMKEATRINDASMAEFFAGIRPGITELSLAESMLKIYRKNGAQGYSFEPLVAFGKNAALGHHAPDNTPLHEGDCVLIDVGCRKDGYCSDMTRTFFYRSASDHAKQVYDIVKRANEAAEAMIKPGVRFCDIDAAARDLITKEGYGEAFTHRLGHSIGLEVHEGEDVSASNRNEVRPGMIFSIEPGIYLEGELGVRIEDLVLVTETGCEVLNSYSKELTIVP
ncbi:M24 family metallopeptidase [Thermocaproicibacter melissae]|jgi:Xaa-Pro dipeptidase|uniref:M24 family metallopeptidase n=1 Tax=Thermocaproicibacter melissae TaxID=2966552 RepID=UPI0024B1AC9B|nr:Xaa-Pro peptidase family protein [Thermocaproicibacter melissae]WBY63993.1 Xaa-Pro peptidase family protein [Thermocaproicibacter melissae]